LVKMFSTKTRNRERRGSLWKREGETGGKRDHQGGGCVHKKNRGKRRKRENRNGTIGLI